MTRRSGARALLTAFALATVLGTAGARANAPGTTDDTQYMPVWIAGASGLTAGEVPALLNLPPGWTTGDAAVVLAPGGDWPPGFRDRLVAALLDSGAAVLELNRPEAGRPPEEALAQDMGAALATLHQAFGAGLVVAIGHGMPGEAAMRAASPAARPGGPAYAAAVALGPGAPRFALNPMPEDQGWPQRAAILCDLIDLAGPTALPDFLARCQDSLALLR
jgi:hypothetical protein